MHTALKGVTQTGTHLRQTTQSRNPALGGKRPRVHCRRAEHCLRELQGGRRGGQRAHNPGLTEQLQRIVDKKGTFELQAIREATAAANTLRTNNICTGTYKNGRTTGLPTCDGVSMSMSMLTFVFTSVELPMIVAMLEEPLPQPMGGCRVYCRSTPPFAVMLDLPRRQRCGHFRAASGALHCSADRMAGDAGIERRAERSAVLSGAA